MSRRATIQRRLAAAGALLAAALAAVGSAAGEGVFTLALSAAAALLTLWRVMRGRASGFLTGLAALLLPAAAVIGMLN